MEYTYNRAELKRDARLAMKQSKASPYITALIFLVITYIFNILSYNITGIDSASSAALDLLESGQISEEAMYYMLDSLPETGPFGWIISVLIGVVEDMLGYGFMLFSLRCVRRLETSFGNLLDSFSMIWKLIGLQIVMGFFILLWSLLLVIPGIVAAYRYRQAVYVLFENPDKGIMDCIRTSKELMYGHKLELFVLDLSFIGWNLLTTIPFVSVYVLPYTETTYANYYLYLTGTAPSPEQRWPDYM